MMDTSNASTGSQQLIPEDRIEKQLIKAQLPIVSGFFLPCAIYYAVVFVEHYFVLGRSGLQPSDTLPAFTAIILFVFWRMLRQQVLDTSAVERLEFPAYMLIYANILLHQVAFIEPATLLLFIFLAVIVAVTAVTLRVAVVATLIPLCTAIWLAEKGGPDTQAQITFVAVAGGFLSFSMSILIRRTIRRQIIARIKAEDLRQKTDNLLLAAEHAADHDDLTGLANRRLFFRQLRHQMDDARPPKVNLAVGLVNLDGLKPVNEAFGHDFGDQLLIETGKRIQKALDGKHLVARLGGDEFAILVLERCEDDDLLEMGCAIADKIHENFRSNGNQISMSSTISWASNNDNSAKKLIDRADYAFRIARKNKIPVKIFTSQDAVEMTRLASVEHHLRTGDLEAELSIMFQPIVDINQNRISGFEALARWHNSELGTVPPDIFIQSAEHAGLMGRLTPILFAKALTAAKNWPDTLRLSFNLSATDLVADSVVKSLCDTLLQSGIAPERVVFEITETSVMSNFDHARLSLQKLQSLGAKVALDDFGTGYANFQHIAELNVQRIKIDRSFIAGLGDTSNSGNVARAIIEMCTNLNVECVSEGVETQAELQALRQLGGSLVQGYFFAKPMPAQKVEDFLSQEIRAA